MDNKTPSTLSVEVLKRGLSTEEFDRLIGLYKQNRLHRVYDRTKTWSTKLSKDENQFLYDVLNSREAIPVLAEKHDITNNKNQAYSRLVSIALRYLYQHREELV